LRLEFLQRRRRAFCAGLRLDHIGAGAGAHVAALFGQINDAADALNLFTGNLEQTLITLHFDVGSGGVAGDIVDRQQNPGLTARHAGAGGVDRTGNLAEVVQHLFQGNVHRLAAGIAAVTAGVTTLDAAGDLRVITGFGDVDPFALLEQGADGLADAWVPVHGQPDRLFQPQSIRVGGRF